MIIDVMKTTARRFTNWIAKPPYYGVPWIVWLYVIFTIMCYPHGGVFAGYLTGYDDPVRMTQVLNWVNGAGWYDRRIMRVDPPDGFQTIWSRIVDIPIALTILILQKFVPQKIAALLAALIVPLIELRLMFEAARYFVRPLVGKNTARLISLFLVFSTISNYRNFSVSGFYPGEASHHPWYIILVTLLFGALARMVIGARSRPPILMAGLSIGLLLAVGIECLPLIAGACALLAIIAWHFNRHQLAADAAQAFSLGALLGLLLLPMHQPLEQIFSISFVEPSLLGPILIATAATFLALSAISTRRLPRNASLCVITLCAIILGAALLCTFPQIHNGAAAGLSPSERKMAYREHMEAQPLQRVASDVYDRISLFLPLLLGLGAGLYAILSAKTRRRQAVMAAYLGFGVITGGMTEIFSRYYHHAVTVACAWLLWLWQAINRQLPKNRYYTLAAFAVFVALGPFTMHLLPAFGRNAPFAWQVMMFPAKLLAPTEPCGLNAFAQYLDTHYSKDTNLLVPGVDSSRILFATNLKIDFLNNYPSQDKFIDNEVFFGTQLPSVAKHIVALHHVDLVAVCKIAMKPMPLQPGEAPMMYELLESNNPPPWLQPVEMDIPSVYRLFKVDKSLLTETVP
jgi:hypothetical protein